ncbi:MAG: HAD family hydrolase [Rikenellaceae bacterium]
MEKHSTIAIVYDFDGTLSPGNMQEFHFIPNLQIPINQFWDEANALSIDNNADSVLCYMERMVAQAQRAKRPITIENLRQAGSHIKLFEGVEEWFEQINQYAQTLGITVLHYVNSSGIREMIEGSSIAKEFHKIYASSFLYNDAGEAYWPAVAINYTNKTQFIFKINKGIESIHDATRVNEYVPIDQRPIPFENIIFIGDGLTDIPSMSLVRSMGGHSIAVYDPQRPDKQRQMMQLIDDKRVDFVCQANYSPQAELQTIIKEIIKKRGVE